MLDFCLSHLPALILLAFLAATVFATARTLPAQNVLAAVFLIALVSGIVETIGTKTGIPFGRFVYTENMGRLLFRTLPWPVPLVWVVVILNSRGAARLILRPWRDASHYGYWTSGVTCLLAVFFDAALEPFAHANRYWFWKNSETVPAWYGAPWMNFAAWAAVSLLILVLVLPWLINKKSGQQSPPDFSPLVLWLLLILLLTAANAASQCWFAAGFSLTGGTIVAFAAIRNSRR
jgi:putative membrane protein